MTQLNTDFAGVRGTISPYLGRCYLAGPIAGLTYDQSIDWRQVAADLLEPRGVTCLSPMRDTDHLKGTKVMAHRSDDKKQEGHTMTRAQAITGRDLFDVERADVLLVNLLGAKLISRGTLLELGAAWALRKPVVLVMEYGQDAHEHGMVTEIGRNYRTEDLMDGVNSVLSLLGTN